MLDEYDGPRLFTLLSSDGFLLLAYQCGEDADTERFLLVPADDIFVDQIKNNTLSLREALLGRSWSWLIDRKRDGTLSSLVSVASNEMPEDALPRSGVRLHPEPDVFFRVRMLGENLSRTNVPASVVRRAVDNTTAAIRALGRYALQNLSAQGYVAAEVRSFYDLPAVDFQFRSFEIAFGYPKSEAELPEDEARTLEQIKAAMADAVEWATAPAERLLEPGIESTAIVNALTKLTPPSRGPVKEVELSGALVGTTGRKIRLTREATDRVAAAKKRLKPDPGRRTFEGMLREWDKDGPSFTLRDDQKDVCLVVVPQELYEEASYAFEEDQWVSIVVDESAPKKGDLVSITSKPRPAPYG